MIWAGRCVRCPPWCWFGLALVFIFKSTVLHLVGFESSAAYYYQSVDAWIPKFSDADTKVCTTGAYSFEYPAEVHRQRGPKTWEEVQQLPCIYLNLGADTDRHGNPKRLSYDNYVAVQGPSGSGGWGCDAENFCGEWCVCWDLRKPIPLPDASVDRIHSEDMMEHIDQSNYLSLFAELHRLLKPGGRARIGVPDYASPINQQSLVAGKDVASPQHLTLTNYALMRKYVDQSSFGKVEWLVYHNNLFPGEPAPPGPFLPPGSFIGSHDAPLPLFHKVVDYSLGMVKRTPDVDWRNNVFRPNFLTSVVFDLVKE